jgi:hypothetical protein
MGALMGKTRPKKPDDYNPGEPSEKCCYAGVNKQGMLHQSARLPNMRAARAPGG